jgi:hypothetical protein
MKKKELMAKQTGLLELRKETLRQLQRVAGGTRIRIPIGFGNDTTPIYDYVDEP